MKNQIILLIVSILFSVFSFGRSNSTWTCIDEKGNTKFSIEAISISEFNNGYAQIYKLILVNNAWKYGRGYIDKTGKIVIPCIYNKTRKFIGDRAWVKKENDQFYTLINKQGKTIPTNNYDKVGYFFENNKNFCAVYQNRQLGFINSEGKEIIPCKYLGSGSFQEGLACVTNYSGTVEKYGFINEKGEFEIAMQFSQAGPSSFEYGYCRVNVNKRTVLINHQGKVVFTTKYGNIQDVYGSLISTFNGKNRTNWGWVNFKDEVVIPHKYEHATAFNKDGLSVVELNGLKGVIDTTGKVVIPFKYNTIYNDISENGIIMAVLPSDQNLSLIDEKKEYYNTKFELLDLPYKYIGFANNSNLISYKGQNNLWGFIDRNYNIVIPSAYSKVNNYSEGLTFVKK